MTHSSTEKMIIARIFFLAGWIIQSLPTSVGGIINIPSWVLPYFLVKPDLYHQFCEQQFRKCVIVFLCFSYSYLLFYVFLILTYYCHHCRFYYHYSSYYSHDCYYWNFYYHSSRLFQSIPMLCAIRFHIPVEFFVTKSDASRPLQNGFWLPFCANFWPWVLPSCKWTPPGTGILHLFCEFVTLQSRPFCRSLEG